MAKMTPYPKYKPSGIEWIGDIPEHWEVNRIKYISTINDETLSESTDEEYELEYLEISDVKSGIGILQTTNYRFKNAPSRARRIVKHGDVIVSTVRTYLKSIAQINSPVHNLIASTGFAVIRPRKLESNYLGYLFYSEFLINEIISLSTGVSYPAINSSQIADIHIPVPTPAEQTAIADYLDAKTAAIDELIATKQKLIELYEEEKTALINQAVTKGLNPNAPMKDSGIDWLGEIPEHWEVKKLKYVAKICSGDSIASNEIKSSGRYQVFGGNGFMGYSEIYNIESDRLIIGRVGALCGNIRYTNDKKFITDNALILELNKNVSYIFMQYLLTTANLNRLNTSSAQPLITGTNVLSLSIVIPNEKEQQSIVDYIETESKKIDTQIANTTQLIELLTEYRTALISEVVTGKINVTN